MPNSVSLTHIGGPTVLIEIENRRLLTDPTFDPAGSEYVFGPVVLKKFNDPAIPAASLGSLDAVLLSHDEHADNLDRSGRALLASAATVFTTPGAASRLGGNSVGLARFESRTLPLAGGRLLTITATPARHGPAGCEPVTGDVTGFMLTWDDHSLYISGDTVWFGDLLEIRSRFRIETALLHLGNVHVDFVGPDNLTMDSAEAIRAGIELEIETIVPIHFEGWAHFQEPKQQVVSAFAASSFPGKLVWPELGVPLVL